MEIALKQANIAYQQGEVPVGAVVVENNELICAAHNQNRKLQDPSAHAEILALRKACEIKGNHRLDGCDLYVTLEPCAMCSAAISLAKIRNLYYGAKDNKFGSVESAVNFFSSKACFHKPEIYSGLCENDCKLLMTSFFKGLR